MRKNIVSIALSVAIGLLVIAGLAYLYRIYFSEDDQPLAGPETVVSNFYADWTEYPGNPIAARAYSESPYVTDYLIAQLDQIIESNEGGGFDPVMCAQDFPESYTIQPGQRIEGRANILVTQDFWGTERQILVEVWEIDGEWFINSIICPEPPPAQTGQREIRALVGEYIEANISALSPEPAVLGGTFYVTEIDFVGADQVLVYYEDGHIALVGRARYLVDSNQNVAIEDFEVISEN